MPWPLRTQGMYRSLIAKDVTSGTLLRTYSGMQGFVVSVRKIGVSGTCELHWYCFQSFQETLARFWRSGLPTVCDVMAINTCNHNPAHTWVLMVRVYKWAPETPEAPVVRTPAENARTLAIEATVMVQTEKTDEETRRDRLVCGGCY